MTNVLNRRCAECGTEFDAARKGKARTFCTDACKAAHANRRTSRGKALIAIAQGWRKSRGSGDFGKFLFGEVTSMLDAWNAEDLAAGRLDAVEYAKLVVEYQTVNPDYHGGRSFEASRYMDRKVR